MCMDKKKNLLLKKSIRVEPKEEKELFTSQTLKEMDMAGLIGGDEPAPCGIIDVLCGTNLYCPSVNIVCSACIGPPKPPPSPGPGGPGNGPGYPGSNCICTSM